MADKKYILAFDTANESISIGLGEICDGEIKTKANFECQAHRASNTKLLPEIENLLKKAKVTTQDITAVAAGRGPGSFTGVRIALASAKGISSGLRIPLFGFNTLEAVAWRAWLHGIRGHIYVVADAMRHEIYPLLAISTESGIKRLSPDKVMKAADAAEEAFDIAGKVDNLTITGDALLKYFDLFEGLHIADQSLWTPSGDANLCVIKSAFQSIENIGESIFSNVLPVYTRLSDAEESEREKLASSSVKNLNVGVQDLPGEKSSIKFQPMDIADVPEIVALEKTLMGSDAWNAKKFESELPQTNRSWWVAKLEDKIIAYAGAMQADNNMELLKIAVAKDYQKQGSAKKIISCVANDMRDLGATKTILEVRKSNTTAIKIYEKIGLRITATRKNYYSDGEDAILMEGALPILTEDVGGMELRKDENTSAKNADHPVIFAIETSCDETACAITCNGKVASDVVASQINFHKRFGGVVPEIASRKHIEAISAVAQTCIEETNFTWKDIDAVAVTYAPGLVGALVVGVAFAKGLAFAIDKPLIIVNHLEGHLYANKLAEENIELPAIASLISGGNTMLVHVKDWGNYETLGTTIDDAAGEAFDKIAKYLGLGYPGGPAISRLAKQGNPNAIKFPRAMIKEQNFDFSLSGLKTAVINYIDKHKTDEDFNLPDLCASFEQAIIDVQVNKTQRALQKTQAKTFLFGGGVAANPSLRKAYTKMCKQEKINMIMPPLTACGDNAAMIALVADVRYKQKIYATLDVDVAAHASLDEKY